MAQSGSTLNFKRESAAFAKALQKEHAALGALLEHSAGVAISPKYDVARAEAQSAYDVVQFQRSRTEAARGVR